MTDVADRAEQIEQWHRDQALAAHRARDTATPLAGGGGRDCLDCDEPIDAARLLAHPGAVRCVDCQARHEHHVGTR